MMIAHSQQKLVIHKNSIKGIFNKKQLSFMGFFFSFCMMVGTGHNILASTHHHTKSGLGSSAAVSTSGIVWIIGVDEMGNLFIQSSQNMGGNWEPPVKIDTLGQAVLADGQNRPKLVFRSETDWLITYTTPKNKPYTGDVMYITSSDNGRSFSKPQPVHDDRQLITHRFENTQVDKDGTAHVLWIDKRNLELNKNQGKPYRGAAIYYNQLPAGKMQFTGDQKIADHTCECCQIATTVCKNGDLLAMWRHIFEPNIRDHAIIRLPIQKNQKFNQITLQRATFEQWALNACPHQGPAITEDENEGIHAVWFSAEKNTPSVRYGRFNQQGKPIGTVIDLPDPQAEFADIGSNGQQIFIVWRSFDGEKFHIKLRESNLDNSQVQIKTLASTLEDNDNPRLLKWKNQTYVFWRTRNTFQFFKLNHLEPSAKATLNTNENQVLN